MSAMWLFVLRHLFVVSEASHNKSLETTKQNVLSQYVAMVSCDISTLIHCASGLKWTWSATSRKRHPFCEKQRFKEIEQKKRNNLKLKALTRSLNESVYFSINFVFPNFFADASALSSSVWLWLQAQRWPLVSCFVQGLH